MARVQRWSHDFGGFAAGRLGSDTCAARANPRTRFAPAQVEEWDSVASVSATCVAQLEMYLLQARSVEAAADALGEGETCRPLAVWLCSHFFSGLVFCFQVRVRKSERGCGKRRKRCAWV